MSEEQHLIIRGKMSIVAADGGSVQVFITPSDSSGRDDQLSVESNYLLEVLLAERFGCAWDATVYGYQTGRDARSFDMDVGEVLIIKLEQ